MSEPQENLKGIMADCVLASNLCSYSLMRTNGTSKDMSRASNVVILKSTQRDDVAEQGSLRNRDLHA
jgi:hypothetical protein